MAERVLVIEEGPAYTCSACKTQIALHTSHIGSHHILPLISFGAAYNVVIGEPSVYAVILNGYKVTCANCGIELGWKDLDEPHRHSLFWFNVNRVSRLVIQRAPAYTCNACNTQIALQTSRRESPDDVFRHIRFGAAYNVVIGQVENEYFTHFGYEVTCANCGIHLGWKDLVPHHHAVRRYFHFDAYRISPPPALAAAAA